MTKVVKINGGLLSLDPIQHVVGFDFPVSFGLVEWDAQWTEIVPSVTWALVFNAYIEGDLTSETGDLRFYVGSTFKLELPLSLGAYSTDTTTTGLPGGQCSKTYSTPNGFTTINATSFALTPGDVADYTQVRLRSGGVDNFTWFGTLCGSSGTQYTRFGTASEV